MPSPIIVSDLTIEVIDMKDSPVPSAIKAGFAGFIAGGLYFSEFAIMVLQRNIILAVFITLCALLSLYLGTVTWKKKRGVLGYVTLSATVGITGVVCGIMTIAFILD